MRLTEDLEGHFQVLELSFCAKRHNCGNGNY